MLRIGFAELVAYRGEVVIWILTTTMPLIMYSIWSTVAKEAPVGRFDDRAFAGYFLSTLVVRQLTSSWVVWELNDVIRSGSLTTYLLRPVHPLLYFASQNLGALPFRFLILAPIVALAMALFPEMSFELDPMHLALYAWTILMGWFLTFAFQAIFGVLALYTQQSLSFQEAWFGIWAILSGYLIPLELMPGVQRVANWLPFRSMLSLPTEILIGHLEGEALVQGLLTQAGWVIFTFVLVRFMWSRAIHRFEAFGG